MFPRDVAHLENEHSGSSPPALPSAHKDSEAPVFACFISTTAGDREPRWSGEHEPRDRPGGYGRLPQPPVSLPERAEIPRGVLRGEFAIIPPLYRRVDSRHRFTVVFLSFSIVHIDFGATCVP